ncbi:hypothetical protein SGQ83_18145 [Flavobacterium sp. Fl-318]|uniref:Nucleotidyltransferase n=1 Tax=Flavobacterium cupriresistens TaxID=2893885 RepID=A0ABU4RL93_9FLAO|nr:MULTISPECIES: hypothetical protein [unclassified Flavobacterium]MDX6191281.1 hypothetical protein [Flavobacterium sp. Fl-318]UFH42401.1 hypothetical protein LNP23_21660 [Flavobacterium sp. F-323]
MARTIAEIQNEILLEKGKYTSLNNLTQSKTSVWNLWVNIVATAVWLHEKIVEKNALISRPHTLNWYREQALNFHYGTPLDPDSSNGMSLVWKEGSYQFDTTDLSPEQIESSKIIKYCAVSEVDLGTILDTEKKPEQIFSDFFHNKIGVVFIKVATVKGDQIAKIDVPNELYAFKEYIAKIKDAGNQVHITSDQGDILKINLNVYIDPLQIYINPNDIEYNQLKSLTGILTPEQKDKLKKYELEGYEPDSKNGSLITDNETYPILEAAKEHLRNIEFNGAFVKTYLVDALQKAAGVKIPILTKLQTSVAQNPNDELAPELYDVSNLEYFIPKAGYFDLDTLTVEVNYIPYNFYRDKQ